MEECDRDRFLTVWMRVREDRPVSDAVEEDLGVKHESPQAILFQGEDVYWHDSHRALTEETFQQVEQKYLTRT